jgi:plasmid stabilization system protein ParE
MSRVLHVEPEAEAELEEAIAWYESRRRGLGLEFARPRGTGRVCGAGADPDLGPEVRGRVRQVVLRRFPYSLYYVLEPDLISILAVFHARRDPRDWHRRG